MTDVNDRQKIIDRATRLIPNEVVSNASTMVISNEFVSAYRRVGNYAFKFERYSSNVDYNIFTLKGGVNFLNSNISGDGSIEVSKYGGSISGSGRIYPLKGNVSIDSDGNIANNAGLTTNLGPVHTSFTIGKNNTSEAAVGVDLKAVTLDMTFFGDKNGRAGFLSEVGTTVGKAVEARVGVGQKNADIAFHYESNGNWPLDTFQRSIISPLHSEMMEMFPNVKLSLGRFFEKTELNYLYNPNLTGDSNLSESAGIVIYETLIGKTPADSWFLARHDAIRKVMNVQKINLEYHSQLKDFTGYSVQEPEGANSSTPNHKQLGAVDAIPSNADGTRVGGSIADTVVDKGQTVAKSVQEFFAGERDNISLEGVRMILPRSPAVLAMQPEMAALSSVQACDAHLQLMLCELRDQGSGEFIFQQLDERMNTMASDLPIHVSPAAADMLDARARITSVVFINDTPSTSVYKPSQIN